MATPPIDRRRLQFSLRGLLIFISLLAVSFSCFHDAYSTEVLPHSLALFLACESLLVAILLPFIRIWKTKLWFILILSSGICFVFLSFASTGLWDGHFELSIDIQPKTSRQISVACYCLEQSRKESADAISQNPTWGDWKNCKQSQDGKSYLAEIPCYGRFDIFGHYGYGEFRYIVVRAKYGDGTQDCVTAEIPEGRGKRSMKIMMP
jgi:hypothetical protein